MRTQAEPRYRKRVPCRVWVEKSSYSGMVLNLSRMGLFVQTSAGVSAGDSIELKFGSDDLLRARVVWQRRVPGALRTIVEGGIGLQIIGAPEAYYRILASAARISG